MSELKEKKFGFVVHPPHRPPCHPPFPGPIPPGIHTQDWIAYINSYIDVRARQIYEKLKNAVPGGGGGSGSGVQSVTYQSSDLGDDTRTIGTLHVDRQQTEIKIPSIDIESLGTRYFNNPSAEPILTLKKIGNNGEDVKVYCEDPNGAILDYVKLRDRDTDDIYMLYMQDGVLLSKKVIQTDPEPSDEDPESEG